MITHIFNSGSLTFKVFVTTNEKGLSWKPAKSLLSYKEACETLYNVRISYQDHFKSKVWKVRLYCIFTEF